MSLQIPLLSRRRTLVLSLLLLAGTICRAQNEFLFSADYTINFPSGSFHNEIKNPAFKGISVGASYVITGRLWAGLSLAYNDYYQKYPRQVYPYGPGSDISAVVSNSIQQTPLLATIDYILVKKGVVKPYVGGGVGVNFISVDQYLGEFDNPASYIRLALQGEVGVLIPISKYSPKAIRIGGNYNYAPLNGYGISNLDNWGVHAGIILPLH